MDARVGRRRVGGALGVEEDGGAFGVGVEEEVAVGGLVVEHGDDLADAAELGSDAAFELGVGDFEGGLGDELGADDADGEAEVAEAREGSEGHIGQVSPGEVDDDAAGFVAGVDELAGASDLDVVLDVRVGEEAGFPEREAHVVELFSGDAEAAEVLDEAVADLLGRGAGAGFGGLGVGEAPLVGELVEDGDDARSVVHEGAVEVEDEDGGTSQGAFVGPVDDAAENAGLISVGEAKVVEGGAQGTPGVGRAAGGFLFGSYREGRGKWGGPERVAGQKPIRCVFILHHSWPLGGGFLSISRTAGRFPMGRLMESHAQTSRHGIGPCDHPSCGSGLRKDPERSPSGAVAWGERGERA